MFARRSGRQRPIGDDDLGPHGLEQLVFAHHPIAMADQVHQDIEDTGLEGDIAPLEAQLAPLNVEQKVLEFIAFAQASPLPRR